MVMLDDVHKSVLQKYPRAVVHMRKQVQAQRFGLVFGAGLSRGFELPTWAALVDMIAEDAEVDGKKVLEIIPPHAGLPYRTEMLFEHFKQKRYDEADPSQHHTRLLDYRIGANWIEIIRKHLYSKVTTNIKDALESHPYLEQYLPLIRQSHMTVTYNFDDFIEQALLESRSESDTSSLGFESVTNPWTQFRRTEAIIYHPNGVVPQNMLEMPSDRLVFSEASYAEQLLGIFAGDNAGLLNHLSKHTCLFIGLSLEDETLRSVLMQAARACPGNYHYYIRYMKAGESIDQEEIRAITRANFKVYNLVTLFANDDEIRALGELIDYEKCITEHFCDFASEHDIPVQFRFYITGAIGVGKSTVINHFRNLHVLDEWLEQRIPLLAKDWKALTSDEKEEVDNWIVGQFKQKNGILRNLREGIFMMDRGPLDPLSFTPEDEWPSKASRILNELCPGHASWKVENGRVILLEGEPSELALRVIVTERKDYTDEKLRDLEAHLGVAYGKNGVIRCDTRGLTPLDVARRVAEIVHLEEYNPICDLHERFQVIQKEGIDAT